MAKPRAVIKKIGKSRTDQKLCSDFSCQYTFVSPFLDSPHDFYKLSTQNWLWEIIESAADGWEQRWHTTTTTKANSACCKLFPKATGNLRERAPTSRRLRTFTNCSRLYKIEEEERRNANSRASWLPIICYFNIFEHRFVSNEEKIKLS